MVTTQRIVHVPSLPDIVAAFERRRGWQELEFWRNICFVLFASRERGRQCYCVISFTSSAYHVRPENNP